MEYLFNDWSAINDKIIARKNIILLCDYDGTLTPIVDTPELAAIGKETLDLLTRLVNKKRLMLGIISGRALPDIKERVSIGGVIYAGNHGLEIEGPGLKFVHPLTDELQSGVRVLSIVLNKALNNIRGVIVEDKGITLSVHYRMVDEAKLPDVHSAFESVVRAARKMGKIRTTEGKKVHEVRPAIAWDKGKAVNLIIDKYIPTQKKKNITVIYLGDDRTDEDAFKVVNQYDGISIMVGKAEYLSGSRYYLNSTGEVNGFLAELYKLV